MKLTQAKWQMAANSRTAVKSSVTRAPPLSPETKSFRQVQQASEHHCHSNKGSPVSVGAVGWQNTTWIGSCCCPHAAGTDRGGIWTGSGRWHTATGCQAIGGLKSCISWGETGDAQGWQQVDATLEVVCFYQNSCNYSNWEPEPGFASQSKSNKHICPGPVSLDSDPGTDIPASPWACLVTVGAPGDC